MPKTFYLDDNFINVALRNIAFASPTGSTRMRHQSSSPVTRSRVTT